MDNFGYCNTTSMGVLPHVDVKRAMEIVLSLDIPFWPQLPLKDFKDDMWVQFSRGFPGIEIDFETKRVKFSTEKFYAEIEEYTKKIDELSNFKIKVDESICFYEFLKLELSKYVAIRGQVTGPMNLGFRILDENNRPIIYNENVRELLFDFVKKKVIWQQKILKDKNPNAFIWIDEPAISWTYSSFSGYTDAVAKKDLREFFQDIPEGKGIHLCINVDMEYLASLPIDILSIEAYQMDILPKSVAGAFANFLKRGKVISWGIVPTVSVFLDIETPKTLTKKLLQYFQIIAEQGDMDISYVAKGALVAPARCCLKNADLTDPRLSPANRALEISQGIEQELMEKAIYYTLEISNNLKKKFSF